MSKKDCQRAETDFLLPPGGGRELEMHLATCPGCREELPGTRKAVELLRALERPEPSREFQDQVLRKIREAVPPRRVLPWRSLAAVAALAVAILGWFLLNRPTKPDRESLIALASDHARRAMLALRERAKSDGYPEEVLRRDHALSGLDENSRRLTSVSARDLPPEVRGYVADIVPNIASVLSTTPSPEVRASANALLANRTLSETAALRKPSATPSATVTRSEDPESDDYLAGRAALYAGDPERASAAFRRVLDRYPQGRFRDGASYWLAQSAVVTGRPEEAAVAYYAALGSSWLEASDRIAIANLVRSFREGPDEKLATVVQARPPRGQDELRIPLGELLQHLEDGCEGTSDVLTIRRHLVTILIRPDWTIIQGDLDPRVLHAFKRIRSFYPLDVKIEPGRPAGVRVRRTAESSIRNDPALRDELGAIRRAIPMMWR